VKLPPRLEALLSYARGDVLADIGTDHAYLPIAACLRNRVHRAVACDVRPGPLKRAKENILHHDLQNKIQTRLGYGLAPCIPGEADVITLSGMGGMKIIDILGRNPETARSAKKIILQPQHDIVRVRKTLHTLHFEIDDEELVQEENRFYHIILASPFHCAPMWSEREYRWGKHPPQKKGVNWQAYLLREQEKINAYLHEASPEKKASLLQYAAEAREFGG
jgi:tRNA (adenine22-N1)-methyltransferase